LDFLNRIEGPLVNNHAKRVPPPTHTPEEKLLEEAFPIRGLFNKEEPIVGLPSRAKVYQGESAQGETVTGFGGKSEKSEVIVLPTQDDSVSSHEEVPTQKYDSANDSLPMAEAGQCGANLEKSDNSDSDNEILFKSVFSTRPKTSTATSKGPVTGQGSPSLAKSMDDLKNTQSEQKGKIARTTTMQPNNRLKKLRDPPSSPQLSRVLKRSRIPQYHKYRSFFLEEADIDSDEDMDGDAGEEQDVGAIEEEELNNGFINDSSQLGMWTQDELDTADPGTLMGNSESRDQGHCQY
jgi:hypothetical protein